MTYNEKCYLCGYDTTVKRVGAKQYLCEKCIKTENGKKLIEKRRQNNRDNWYINKEKYNAKRRKPKVTKICVYCEKEFKTARGNQKFCSPDCKKRWHYKKNKHKQAIRQKATIKVFAELSDKKGKCYTKKEILYIRKNCFSKTIKQMALELKRPYAGLVWKVRQIRTDMQVKKELGL